METETSPAEQRVIKAVGRAKLFVFLRRFRHLLFDEAFQVELAGMYTDSDRGRSPVPPGVAGVGDDPAAVYPGW